MKQYIDYFLNYLQTEKDAASSTIHKYRADLERLFEYLQVNDINEINQNNCDLAPQVYHNYFD